MQKKNDQGLDTQISTLDTCTRVIVMLTMRIVEGIGQQRNTT